MEQPRTEDPGNEGNDQVVNVNVDVEPVREEDLQDAPEDAENGTPDRPEDTEE